MTERWIQHRTPQGRSRGCTCRLDRPGYQCRRYQCDNDAQVCGGNCTTCFERFRQLENSYVYTVTLCGSTRFFDEFQEYNYRFTMAGLIVLSVGFYPHASSETGHGEGVGHDSAEKVALDVLHKRKISRSDLVFVIDVDGYIGDSTRSEIHHALWDGKPVFYHSANAFEAAVAYRASWDRS